MEETELTITHNNELSSNLLERRGSAFAARDGRAVQGGRTGFWEDMRRAEAGVTSEAGTLREQRTLRAAESAGRGEGGGRRRKRQSSRPLTEAATKGSE